MGARAGSRREWTGLDGGGVGEVFRPKAVREKLVDRPHKAFGGGVVEHDDRELETQRVARDRVDSGVGTGKFADDLSAHAAGGGAGGRVGDDGDGLKGGVALADGLGDGGTLGADAGRVGCVLDVAACVDLARLGEEGAADAELGVGAVRKGLGVEDGFLEESEFFVGELGHGGCGGEG